MKARYMTAEALSMLLLNFDEAKPRYMAGDQEWFLSQLGETGLRESRYDYPNLELDMGEGRCDESEYAATDCANIRIIYRAMGDLPLNVASDQRFWTGLSHDGLWNYVMYRRKAKIASGKDGDIKNSFFFGRGTKRSAHVHCISRLWWAGRIAYDPENEEDPFALVDILAESAFASRLMLFSSSNLTACKETSLGILDAIKSQKENGAEIKREHFVGATKYLNRMGALTVVDCLGRKEIREIIEGYFATDEFKQLKV